MDTLTQLTDEGVALWLDGVDRASLTPVSLARAVREQHVTGARLGARALVGRLHDDEHRDRVTALGRRGTAAADAALLLHAHDVQLACDVLQPVFADGGGRDGLVSAGLGPVPLVLAQSEARVLHREVDRPNLLLRVPAGEPWLPVVSALLAEGIGVEVGPICSLERYLLNLDAFLDGLERAARAGLDLAAISSVASFPLRRLDILPGHRLCGAVARLVLHEHDLRFRGSRWQALARAGARPQRLLWTATDTPGPPGPDTRHVDGFVAWGVISSMTQTTLDAVADHALLDGDTLTGRHITAGYELQAMERRGVRLPLMTRQLERRILDEQTAARDELHQVVAHALTARRGASVPGSGDVAALLLDPAEQVAELDPAPGPDVLLDPEDMGLE